MITTEFVGGETCTATIHQQGDEGESYAAPLHIGFYAEGDEIWIDQDNARIQFTGKHLDALIKQLRRAKKLAAEALKTA